MLSFFKRLRIDERGNVIAIVCACMPLVIGAAGLATDTIQWTLWKRQLQRAADSAAIAGVYDREANNSSTNTPAAVCHDLTLNLHTFMKLQSGSTPCGSTSPVGSYDAISYDGSCPTSSSTSISNQVCVTLKVQHSLPFSGFFSSFGFVAPTIQASATAGSISAGTPCALALNSTGTAMDYSGNATVSAASCVLYSDSNSANAASAGGSSLVTAKSIAAVGGIQHSSNFSVSSYIPYSPSIADPFQGVTPDPNDMKCAQAAVTQTTTVIDTAAYDETVTTTGKNGKTTTTIIHHPAVTHDVTTTTYTGASQALTDGMDITTMKDSNGNQANCFTSLSTGSNKTLAIPDSYTGPIYLNGGGVDFKGNFSCAHCTIVLTNKDPTSTTIGGFSSNAQATNNITAPTTGTYAGIAFFQDRRASSNTVQINGGSGSVINGGVYFPNATLRINGSGLVDSSGNAVKLCAMWVAKNITFLGNSSIGLSSPDDAICAGYGLPTGSGVKMVRLVA
jgi:hypothetical protein